MNPEKLQLVISVDVYENTKQLPTEEATLIHEATKAMHNAYAPYSKFNVGTALLLENGKIITGNNQENAAYPSGMCAERVAIFYAGSQYPGVAVKTIAVICDVVADQPLTPCGACRQAIAEYEQTTGKKIKIVMATTTGKIYTANSIETLLPFMFSGKYIRK
ncbi:MAG TPA: cytidine deaminase [Bacteroidia bacterium]|nr:cytidine deaminase [Bacteroidia bacterium]